MAKLFVTLLLCAGFLHSTGQDAYREDIRDAATVMIQSLRPLQKKSAMLALDDTARIQWNNLPVGLRARSGISIGNMDNDQRRHLHRLLSVCLSSQGYLKATAVMNLDNLLNILIDSAYGRQEITDSVRNFLVALQWSPGNYFLAFFGQPSDTVWGFKLEGHHLSINYTISGKDISVTPWFIGTDPAELMETEYAGLRVLGQEEDLGIKLIRLLNPAQQKKAIASSAVPSDIITSATSNKRLVENWGIKGSELTTAQQQVLEAIIREYVFNMEYNCAVKEYAKIQKAGMRDVYFGWIGPYEESKPHYFILNGPGFLIEFDNAGGPRNQANHIHTIWREKGNEFGEDMLKKHYLETKH